MKIEQKAEEIPFTMKEMKELNECADNNVNLLFKFGIMNWFNTF